ncbi:head decoration protein [Pseudoalteromonas sp. MMG024]|uniref:head decoration protein n=1 Tax=Pseudoalteromonas sp. MMG024 TaxID=2909980 RepID=UPI001F37FDAE|nr:head decoration protein [Pseudoalteromonas sp. MMG024]MCF6459049.1 head decoration protein [Pseudoalteromonas sp. MMG024]
MQSETAHMLPRASAHVMNDLPQVSKDEVTISEGVLASGTVLGEKPDGTHVQLVPGTGEANAAVGILYGHADASAGPVKAQAHARVAAFYADRITWPDGITAEQKETAIAELAALNLILR